MHILEKTISEANAAGRTALIPFITAGFPSIETFPDILEQIDEVGADIIEIGVPFSDPVADGPVVEAASVRALQQGVTLKKILEELRKRVETKGFFHAKIVLMGYLNPFFQYGMERFAKDAQAAGVVGCIIPDLPLDESDSMRNTLKDHDIALISLVGPNTSVQRMKEYAAVSDGYVYVVSVLGTTGTRAELPPEVTDTLQHAKQAFSLPIALGFGLRHPSQLEVVPENIRPNAAIFGSSLLKHIDAGGTVADFFAPWTSK